MRSVTLSVNRRVSDLTLDVIEVDPSGLIRVIGWSSLTFEPSDAPTVRLDDKEVPFLQSYRRVREDVRRAFPESVARAGLTLEYLVPESLASELFRSISIHSHDVEEFRAEAALSFINPHYRGCFDGTAILHREHIYGAGCPCSAADPGSVELARALPGPVLDFGCGSGALIADLQALGLEAQGLELEIPPILKAIPNTLRSSITLYDGKFPSPFETGAFASVFCSEVLEHIPDFQAAVREIARLARDQVIITVPDTGVIPLGFRHFAVPWHLLEATHVNFFNQTSLHALLRPHFESVEFTRMCPCRVNDTTYYVNLVAICRK